MIRHDATFLLTSFAALALAGSAFGAETPAPPVSQTRVVSLEDAISNARRQHTAVRISQAGIDAAKAGRWQALARFGPSLKAEGSYLIWDDELTMSFGSSLGGGGGGAAQLPPPATPYETALAGLLSGLSSLSTPLVVRDKTTSNIKLSVTQPITSLYPFFRAYQLQSLELDLARSQYAQSLDKATLDAVTAYFRFMQALAMSEVADKSVQQLEEHAGKIDAMFKQGLVARGDVMKILVGLAAARQNVIKARAGVAGGSIQLALAMGLPVETPLAPVPVSTGSAPPPLTVSLEEATTQAFRNRTDVQDAASRAYQAGYGVQLAMSRFFPDVAAIGTMDWSQGSQFSPEKSWFVGVGAQWSLWEWGGTFFEAQKARARAEQAGIMAEETPKYVQLDVMQAYLNLTTALEGYNVAQAALDAAEEGYRIESIRFEQGAASSSDLLDAESARTQAYNGRDAAFFECLIANAALLKATGAPVMAADLLPGGRHVQQ